MLPQLKARVLNQLMTTQHLPVAIQQTISVLPSLAELEPNALEQLGQAAHLIEAPAGHTIFRPGSTCENYIIVLSGTVRTFVSSESGREIVLYRIEGGQTCILTTSCLMTNSNYDTEAVAETDVTALSVPRTMFLELLGTSQKFRHLAFNTFSERLHELVILINEISFGHLDTRLATYLITKANDNIIIATHQSIAMELGSAREAVSRLLKDFERKGLVELDRGRIIITQRTELENYQKK